MLLQQNRAEGKLLPLLLGSPRGGRGSARDLGAGDWPREAGISFCPQKPVCPAAAHWCQIPQGVRWPWTVSWARQSLRLSASGPQDERRGGVVLRCWSLLQPHPCRWHWCSSSSPHGMQPFSEVSTIPNARKRQASRTPSRNQKSSSVCYACTRNKFPCLTYSTVI